MAQGRYQSFLYRLRGGAALNGVKEEDTARGLHLFLCVILLWYALILVYIPIIAARKITSATIAGVLVVLTLVSLRLIRTNRVRAAAILFVTMHWCSAELVAALAGGLNSIWYALVLLIIVNAGWLLGRSSAIGFTVATLLIAIVESALANLGHPIPRYFPMRSPSPIFLGILLFALSPILSILNKQGRQVSALRESEDSYHTIVNAINDAVFVLDIDTGMILEVNQSACEMFGYSVPEMRKLPRGSLSDGRAPYSPADLVGHFGRAQPGSPAVFEWHSRHRDGHMFWSEIAIRRERIRGVDRMVMVLRDISVRKRIEEQLRQAQKMEALGRMAGGVAHDFNNLLTVINGYSRMLIARSRSAGADSEQLNQILKAGEQAAALTKQLLAFSRKQVIAPRNVDLNNLVRKMIEILNRIMGEDVSISTMLEPALGTVLVDPDQMNQVIMNLAVNARDAMPHGGKLLIETQNVELGPDYGAKHPEVVPGSYVMLTSTDSGVGMDEATAQLIFEPFFTTKEMGKGTGLGLATVHGIVRQSGGWIWVYSEPGKGTSFRIYLPRSDSSSTADTAVAESPARRTGGESILVVEDAEGVRGLMVGVLRELGYHVLVAASGDEAMRVAADAGSIDLLLTDVVLPGITGPKLAERLRESKPGLRVLYTSGYTENVVVHRGVLKPGFHYLPKPFTPEGLAAKVNEVLS